ncbi:hypothetical protein SDC9_203321 [bioreactor metagenome]|uniref:Uncharacterized protein n=1 Tax=bioreactor metagenome TaxID=1076179 RepID=A0A645IWW5_9ZZZZ
MPEGGGGEIPCDRFKRDEAPFKRIVGGRGQYRYRRKLLFPKHLSGVVAERVIAVEG